MEYFLIYSIITVVSMAEQIILPVVLYQSGENNINLPFDYGFFSVSTKSENICKMAVFKIVKSVIFEASLT